MLEVKSGLTDTVLGADRVWVGHWRVTWYGGGPQLLPRRWAKQTGIEPKGGATAVVVRDKQTGHHHIGIAVCSLQDSYNNRVGRQLAENRAYDAWLNGRHVNAPELVRHPRMLAAVVGSIPIKFMVGG